MCAQNTCHVSSGGVPISTMGSDKVTFCFSSFCVYVHFVFPLFLPISAPPPPRPHPQMSRLVSEFSRGLKGLKVGELPAYVGGFSRTHLTPSALYARTNEHLHGPVKSQMDAGSVKPLFNTMALLFVGAYALAWPTVSGMWCVCGGVVTLEVAAADARTRRGACSVLLHRGSGPEGERERAGRGPRAARRWPPRGRTEGCACLPRAVSRPAATPPPWAQVQTGLPIEGGSGRARGKHWRTGRGGAREAQRASPFFLFHTHPPPHVTTTTQEYAHMKAEQAVKLEGKAAH